MESHPTAVNYYKYKDGPFICPECGKCYKWKKTLIRHLSYECGKDPPFVCPLCPVRTTQKNKLRNHIQVRHNEFLQTIEKHFK